jgi:hypothetical protein
MVEAIYAIRSRPIEMAATSKEARRVLEWQQDVARSVTVDRSPTSSVTTPSVIRDSRPPVSYRRADSYPVPASQTATERPLRLVRRDTITTETYRRPDEKSSFSNGLKLVGTLVGAAAGASLAYSLLQDKHKQPAPPPRRASYDTPSNTYSPVVQRIPASGRSKSGWEGGKGYVAQYAIAAPHHRVEEGSVRTGRSAKYSTRERSRSEAGSRYERPLPGPGSHVSHVSQKSERSHRSDERSSYHGSSSRKEGSFTERERAKGGYADKVQYVTVDRAVERDRRSNVSARMVPLPNSVVGGYAASVAPSDSVSSVGTKRERERLRERMRERW